MNDYEEYDETGISNEFAYDDIDDIGEFCVYTIMNIGLNNLIIQLLLLDDDFEENSVSLKMVTEDCVYPILLDAFNNLLFPLLIANIASRVTVHLCHKANANSHISLILLISNGLTLVFYTLGYHNLDLSLCFVACCLFGVILSLISPNRKAVWSFSLLAILLNESVSIYTERFMRLRPHIMLLVMKLISCDDYFQEVSKEHTKQSNAFLKRMSYIMHPGSVVLGCYHPPFQRFDSGVKVFEFAKKYLLAIIWLIVSTCLIQTIIYSLVNTYVLQILDEHLPEYASYLISKLLSTYLIALQFRASHYFICHLAEAHFIFWNHEYENSLK